MASGARDAEGSVAILAKVFAIFACGLAGLAAILWTLERLGAPASVLAPLCVFVPLAAYVLLGVLARTGDPIQVNVAGRAVPAAWNGMAAGAGFVSASSVFGLAGALYLLGYDGLAYGLGSAGGFVLAGLLIAPFLRKSGAETLPDFFAARYGLQARLLAAFILMFCSFALIVVEISAAGLVASRFLAVPFAWAVLALAAAAALTSIFGGMKAVTAAQVAQYAVLIVGYLVPILMLAARKHGLSLPQISYGAALDEITRLETGMLEKGLADAKTMKPHATAFLQLDAANFYALILCSMIGAASLPHVLTRYLTARSVRDARFSAPWALIFVLPVLLTAPAYAAFAKAEVYALIESGTRFASLPAWMEPYSRLDLVHIHGVSLKMLDEAIAAVRAGATDIAGVAAYLKSEASSTLAAWSEIKVPAKAAVLDVAKQAAGFAPEQKWEAFRHTILPAAALAAGNKSGLLTQGALVVDPGAVIFASMEIAGMPILLAGLLVAGGMAAALATANGLLIAMGSVLGYDIYYRLLDRDAAAPRRLLATRAALLAVAGLGACAAVARPPDLFALAGAAVSLAGAGLFPALVLGIWWKRANAWGAVAGMAAGAALSLYYFAGTRYFAVDFYEVWSHVSNASEAAARKFTVLKGAWEAAQGETKAAAWTALEAHARGTAAGPGVANWFGIQNVSSALFGLPLGVLVVVAVSLLTPRPSLTANSFVEAIRRPSGEPPILKAGD